MNEANEAHLDVSNLYVDLGVREVLRGIDLQARSGEVLGILGPSGAGKSTLFRTLAGELSARSGTIRMNGTAVERMPLWQRARSGLGYIPQEPSVFWDLTVAENVALFAELRGVTQDTSNALARVALTTQRDARARDLSGGERRRLEFLRATLGKPRLLLCDEPFAGVDPAGALHLGDLLASLAAEGVAVILADHHVEEALRICTRAILLLDGSIAVNEAPEAFRSHSLVQGRYLGTFRRSLPPRTSS
jgi:lipopolysaccharide export system ATP-binding protein